MSDRGLVERGDVGMPERFVESARRGRLLGGNPDPKIQMAARHFALDGGAQGILELIELAGGVEMQVKATVIETLEADRDLGVFHGFADSREAGHAADGR